MSRPPRLRSAAVALLASLWLVAAPATAAPAAAPPAQAPAAADCDRILLSAQLGGRTVDAADALDDAMARLGAQANPDPEALGRCALYTAILYQGAGDYSTALEGYTIARDAFVIRDDTQMIWSARYGRAAILAAQGRTAEAQEELEAALALSRAEACWLPQDIKPIAEAATLNNLGTVRALEGDLGPAGERVAEALAMFEEQAAASNGGMGEMAGLFGELAGGEQDEVSALVEQLLGGAAGPAAGQGESPEGAMADLLEQLLGGAPPEGTAPGDQGGPGSEAIPPEAVGAMIGGLFGALTGPCAGESGLMGMIFSMLMGGQIGPQLGAIFAPVAQNNQGEILRRQGELERAEALLRDALARLEAGEGSGDTFTSAPSSALAAAVANNLGMVAYDRKDYAAALERFTFAEERLRSLGQRRALASVLIQIGYTEQLAGDRRAAAARYAEAMDILDRIQAIDDGGAAQVAVGAGLGGPSSAASLSGSLAPFADVYNLAAGLAFADGDVEGAFAATERGRARLFIDLVRSARLRSDDPVAAELLDRERRAAFLLASVGDQLAQAEALDPPNPTLVSTSREQLAKAEARYADVLAELAGVDPRLRDLVTSAEDILDLAEVQGLLDAETTLVSYYQFDERTPGVAGTIAFVITRSAVTPVALPDATAQAVNANLADLDRWPVVDSTQRYPRALVELHRLLVADLPITTEMVGIIPHQSLHKVPFAALSSGEDYFGAERTLFLLPSASALPTIRANGGRGAGPATALIFGNPDATGAGLQRLRAAGAEAEAVGDLLGQPEQTSLEASEARLRAEVEGVTVLHLAAHGVYSTTNPLASAIYLTPGQGDDGALTAGEVLTLNLGRSELVALSACDSNLGELSTGDELVGLTRAFFTAGTPAVLSSLWQVDDVATSAMMSAFYRAWQRDGLGRAEALRAAQEELRQSEDYASPFFWAAFVLNGDPGPGRARFDLPAPSTPTPTPPTPTPSTPSPAPAAAATEGPAAAGGVAEAPAAPTPGAASGAALCGLAIVLPAGASAALWRRARRRQR